MSATLNAPPAAMAVTTPELTLGGILHWPLAFCVMQRQKIMDMNLRSSTGSNHMQGKQMVKQVAVRRLEFTMREQQTMLPQWMLS
jgi:hypothetical protein